MSARILRALVRRLLVIRANWHTSGSRTEIERLTALRYDLTRLPPSVRNSEMIEDIGQLIANERRELVRIEQRKNAILSGAL